MWAARSLIVLAALVVSSASAAQEKPDSPRLGPEADRVEVASEVVRCDLECRRGTSTVAGIAGSVPPLPVRSAMLPDWAGGISGLLFCTAPGVLVPGPTPAEITSRGITVRPLGHPEPEPAEE